MGYGLDLSVSNGFLCILLSTLLEDSSPPGFLPLQMALGRIRSGSLFSGGGISNFLYSVAAAGALNSSIALTSRIQISGIGPLC